MPESGRLPCAENEEKESQAKDFAAKLQALETKLSDANAAVTATEEAAGEEVTALEATVAKLEEEKAAMAQEKEEWESFLEAWEGGEVKAPENSYVPYRKRLFTQTGLKLLVSMLGFQVVGLVVLALVFKNPWLAIGALFISLGFLNIFVFRFFIE